MVSLPGTPSGARDQEYQGSQDRSSSCSHGVCSLMKEVDKVTTKQKKYITNCCEGNNADERNHNGGEGGAWRPGGDVVIGFRSRLHQNIPLVTAVCPEMSPSPEFPTSLSHCDSMSS